VISPTNPTVNVTLGTNPVVTPLQFTATYSGASVTASWSIDQGQLGTMGASTGVFTPASLGGTATVTASYQGASVTTQLTVHITYVGIGDPSPADAGAGGAGGYGGVGGSGEGAGATPGQVTTLSATPTADPALSFVYPYDKTVFPQAILPPLLQWTYGTHTFTAVYIHITETNYEYKGYFQAPTAEASAFQNHPVPQSAWTGLEYSNGGTTDPVNVQLTFADASNAAWGPISETWIFAQGELKGTIYYNSYGTNLASNWSGAILPDGGTGPFGGATLGIKEGQTSPVLIAGTSVTSPSGCRVCHSVAAGGSVLITQQGEQPNTGDETSSAYALTAGDTENVLANNNNSGILAWPALYPDGTFLLSNSGPLSGASTEQPSALYSTTDGSSIASFGLDAGVGALTPAFSPDGTHVAYNFYGGTGSDQTSLAAMDFTNATKTFANARTLAKPASGWAYWPSFFPTNDGVVFEVETRSNGRDLAGTRGNNDNQYDTTEDGAHGELWWVDLATMTPTRLDNLNGLVTSTGLPYLPPHPTGVQTALADGGVMNPDVTLNYEPTVNPVPSGGYAWVVFTSRRLYGNVATINPYWSDPRNENLVSNVTTKKLWVAAIDLNPKAGTDPSHPAFYLPAQEILAGNARGFWVVDPCQQNGTSCVTGDECCTGYCQAAEDGGGLQCTSTKPACSAEYEKCTTSADCCTGGAALTCINGLCSQTQPQ
jgi:hypothetical protein